MVGLADCAILVERRRTVSDASITPATSSSIDAVSTLIKSVLHKAYTTYPAELEPTFDWVLDQVQANSRFLHLPFLTYQATQPSSPQTATADLDRIVPVAAAWHVLACAARLLDDVEDGEELPVSSFGPAQAMNAATALIFVAQLALASLRELGLESDRVLDVVITFNTATAHMAAGQADDLALGRIILPRPDDFWRIAGAKSGEFFALLCRAGAMLAAVGPGEIAACGNFGYNLGVLVQISDDLRALWLPRRRGDLTTARRTLPVVYAWSVADLDTRRRLDSLLDQAHGDDRALSELQAVLADLGALHYTALQAGLHRQRARDALLGLLRPSRAQYELLTLLDAVFPVMAMGKWSSPPSGATSIA